ncbi:Uncharacterised protein [Providencia rustigianii]|nr:MULTISPECIES: hypothetical protein [Providencia]MTC55998.1 hypothetical protein [Providencia rustigianii]MTC58512.1 hypothetical protein [Providencia rustigianii]SPY78890.1 Uncharacterised protein [Providencia rustigianii]VEB75275.1 Uncharacterised protein [Providencia rustigianii]VEH56685.1 Uncharacterised protein [Providencia rustigianii]
MNIESDFLEKSCNGLRNIFSSQFNWDDMDLSFSRVDLSERKIFTISSNYEWVLIYWSDDLDLLISERLSSGIQYWDNYSKAYTDTLVKVDKKKIKVDLCTKYGNVFELASINSKSKLSIKEINAIYKYRAIVSDYAQSIWQKDDDSFLPQRENIILSTGGNGSKNEVDNDLLDIHQYMRFGNIRFTRKEMITIRLLLSHCKVKEISYIQGCAEANEHKRIQRIKEKLNCPHVSSSGLFTVLKDHGITLACLEMLVSYP